MSFIEEIKKVLDIDEKLSPSVYRAIIFGDSGAYFENVLGIACFCPDTIELCIKRGCIRICGENLKIKKLFGQDVAIMGKITKIERV